MLPADQILLISWALLAIVSCVSSLHLYRDLGVIVASQAFLPTLSALMFAVLVRNGAPTAGAMAIAGIGGAALGLAHVPLLRLLGVELLLVVTAIAHIVIQQFWLALPEWTGGSGGLLVPGTPSWATPAMLGSLAAFGLGYRYILHQRAHSQLAFAAVRNIGEQAGALGVPALAYYRIAFGVYGFLLGLCGAEAVRVTGFVVVEMFGLAWALTIVLITLIAGMRPNPLPALIGLAVSFALVKVGLRQFWEADPRWSHGYDVLVPALLIGVYFFNQRYQSASASNIRGRSAND